MATRILLVEDHQDTREMLARLLVMWGYSVMPCSTGAEALAIVPAFQPKIILLDLGLPGMDGYDLAKHLRPLVDRAILIALTGYGQQADVERCRQAGFDVHLLKPVSLAAGSQRRLGRQGPWISQGACSSVSGCCSH
ncbi:MAG: response regulator [Pirellulales bacterium]